MKPRRCAVVVSFLALAGTTLAQGVNLPRPLVRMTHLTARVEIVDGAGSTTLRQVWRNDGQVPAEATWLLPLPAGAVADGFRMTVNEVEMSGEVLGADQARGIYESIVSKRRDPGLLEYFGRGCLRARIFPIPPCGEVTAEVSFRAVLPELLGLRRWTFALGAAGAEGLSPEQVVLDLSIRSKRPLKNVFSPVPSVRVAQKDDHEARASFEGSPASLQGGELAVFYGLSDEEFGLDLLSHRRSGDAEGTFLLLISPKRAWEGRETLAKSIHFVLDVSGSMQGAKIEQARNALRLFLQSLAPGDRFNVIPFSTEPEPFFPEPVSATGENVMSALARVERLEAAGGTNIADSLLLALRAKQEGGRVPIVVFLTDGLATVGEKDPQSILAAVRRANGSRARLFVFGVGADVDVHLLDTLAAENGGVRDYVRPEERIDDKTRVLFAKLSHPVMSDVALAIDGLSVARVVPAQVPDLFIGDRVEVLGRYAGEGPRAIRLSGVVAGERREYVYEATFPRETGAEHAFVPALWAERRIGVLLDAIRLNGPDRELVCEVEKLGREYRIVTPYTSHLVLEQGLGPIGLGGPAAPGAPGGAPGGRYRGPGDSVPPGTVRAAGPSGPASPGARPVSDSDAWFLGHGGRRERDSAPTLDEIALRLSESGVLPKDAPPAELARLAGEVVRELRESEQRWSRLGQAITGAAAVDDSVYLAQLVGRGGSSDERGLAELFTRRVQDKVFTLRGGVWIDQACASELPAERRIVEAFSGEYFALLASRPELAPYLAFSTRLIVKLGSEVFEVAPPRS